MNIVAIIQARFGSRRLPGKCLMDINGKPMIAHVVERACAIPGVTEVVLNVPQDNDAHRWKSAIQNACPVVHVVSQEANVLASYELIANKFQADVVIRLTGDCPLLASNLSGEVLQLFLDKGPDYCANIQPYTTWADGWDTEVFTIDALRYTSKMATSRWAKEHVTVMMRQLCACIYGPEVPFNIPDIKLSVDTQWDLDQVRDIQKKIPPGDYSWKSIYRAIHS